MGSKHSVEEEEDEDDIEDDDVDAIRKNTNFSGDEIRDLYAKFQADFPEGVITQQDFGKMYAALFPDGDTSRFARHVFRAYDVDGNGVIDFHEFVTTVAVAAKGSFDEKLSWAFRLYDLDGNGTVSREEATEMIMAIYRMQGVRDAKEKADDAALQFFLFLDKNKDDSLSRQEFINAIRSSPAVRELLKAL